MSHSRRPSCLDAKTAGVRKRVDKACDRCRMKKARCDGSQPCLKCKDANSLCHFSARKPYQNRIHPKGYVELLEQQQRYLVTGLQVMYRRLRAVRALTSPNLPEGDAEPRTHDILTALNVLDQAPTNDQAGGNYGRDPHSMVFVSPFEEADIRDRRDSVASSCGLSYDAPQSSTASPVSPTGRRSSTRPSSSHKHDEGDTPQPTVPDSSAEQHQLHQQTFQVNPASLHQHTESLGASSAQTRTAMFPPRPSLDTTQCYPVDAERPDSQSSTLSYDTTGGVPFTFNDDFSTNFLGAAVDPHPHTATTECGHHLFSPGQEPWLGYGDGWPLPSMPLERQGSSGVWEECFSAHNIPITASLLNEGTV